MRRSRRTIHKILQQIAALAYAYSGVYGPLSDCLASSGTSKVLPLSAFGVAAH